MMVKEQDLGGSMTPSGLQSRWISCPERRPSFPFSERSMTAASTSVPGHAWSTSAVAPSEHKSRPFLSEPGRLSDGGSEPSPSCSRLQHKSWRSQRRKHYLLLLYLYSKLPSLPFTVLSFDSNLATIESHLSDISAAWRWGSSLSASPPFLLPSHFSLQSPGMPATIPFPPHFSLFTCSVLQ